MRKLFLTILTLVSISIGILGFSAVSEAYVNVRGYWRYDGTWVRPYIRTYPNEFLFDNFSYRAPRTIYDYGFNSRLDLWTRPRPLPGGYNWNSSWWNW